MRATKKKVIPDKATRRIPWWLPQMTGKEEAAIAAVLQSNFLNEGQVTEQFEHAVAARLGVKHAIAATSGTSGLFLALAGLGIGPGDDVIVPDLTFIATANAVRLTGANVVLADINPATLTLDPGAVERMFSTRTKAIVPVHVSGRAAEMDALLDIAQRRGVTIVEDAAEAFTSKHRGRTLGTMGAAGMLSFSPHKTITTGQGGMVVTNDDALSKRVRMLKDHGRPVRGTGGDDVHESIGYNFRLTNLQAAVGLAQLSALDERLARQKRNYELYAERLKNLPGITLPGFDLQGGEIPLWTDALVDRRDELDDYLAARGMGCRRLWRPLHTQNAYRTPAHALQNSVAASRHGLWLPSAFTLSDEDVAAVCESIREFLLS